MISEQTAVEALRWIAVGKTGSYGTAALFAQAVLSSRREDEQIVRDAIGPYSPYDSTRHPAYKAHKALDRLLP